MAKQTQTIVQMYQHLISISPQLGTRPILSSSPGFTVPHEEYCKALCVQRDMARVVKAQVKRAMQGKALTRDVVTELKDLLDFIKARPPVWVD
jgi:hypothetical protein